eukprot:TRINITY_DN7675_c0_g1_i1.p1 TRINITY_DN7675_c0_g1~~TRINITY_DN7675_c0_g1_i1.p1  ORF type:complete len:587 (-),score=126.76 TRINITY_DN7675_c0_g1_i1:11-1744(-)
MKNLIDALISIEQLPQERIEFFSEEMLPDGSKIQGKEQMVMELTPDDVLLTLVRQLDWSKVIDDSNAQLEKMKSEEHSEWARAKKEVEIHLGRACEEVNKMIEAIKMVKDGNNLNLVPSKKPPLPPILDRNDLYSQIQSTKEQLGSAAEKLSSSYTRLHEIVGKENRYFQGVLQLRRNWRVGSINMQIAGEDASVAAIGGTQTMSHNIPIFTIDYGYFYDGSRVPAPEISLQPSDNGEPVISLSAEDVNLNLYIGKGIPKSNDSATLIKAEGVPECHEILQKAQSSLYTSELFNMLSHDALRYDDNECHEIFQHYINVDAYSEEFFNIVAYSKGNEEYQIFEDYVETDQDNKLSSLHENYLFETLNIYLRQILRNKYRENMIEASKIKFSKDFVRKIKTENTFEKMLQMNQHIRTVCKLYSLLNKLATNVHGIKINTVNTYRKLLNCIEILYEGCIVIPIYISKNVITLNEEEFDTVEEFSEFLFIYLGKKMMNNIFSFIKFLSTSSEMDFLTLNATFGDNNICFEIEPDYRKYTVHLRATTKVANNINVYENNSWYELEGYTNSEKARNLVMKWVK